MSSQLNEIGRLYVKRKKRKFLLFRLAGTSLFVLSALYQYFFKIYSSQIDDSVYVLIYTSIIFFGFYLPFTRLGLSVYSLATEAQLDYSANSLFVYKNGWSILKPTNMTIDLSKVTVESDFISYKSTKIERLKVLHGGFGTFVYIVPDFLPNGVELQNVLIDKEA